MSIDLVYRMRTCSAALLAEGTKSALLTSDAANLLIEASNTIEKAEPLGELMAKIEAAPATGPTWTTMDLPIVTPRPCPNCGSIDARTARIANRKVTLECPKCAHQWGYQP